MIHRAMLWTLVGAALLSWMLVPAPATATAANRYRSWSGTDKTDGGTLTKQDGVILTAERSPAPKIQVAARYGTSVRGMIDDLPFVVLRGSLAERAEAFGALSGKDCTEMMNGVILPKILQVHPQGWDLLVMLSQGLFPGTKDDQQQASSFIAGFRKAAPVADRAMPALGRELSADNLRVAQGFIDLASAGRVPLGGCSSFSAWGALTPAGEVVCGRNSDYATFAGHMPMMVIAQQPSEKDRLATMKSPAPASSARAPR